MMFPFLTVFIIFVVVLHFRYSALSKSHEEREREFWEREEEAMHTEAKDLSEIEYLKIPLDELPIGVLDDDEVLTIEDELRSLSSKPILNLNGKTNTDIRIEYGTDNFDAVSGMGENFDRLTTLLVDYAKCFMENDDYEDASKVLEYGCLAGSDVSFNYTLLAECYEELGRSDKRQQLMDDIQNSNLTGKERILDKLRAV